MSTAIIFLITHPIAIILIAASIAFLSLKLIFGTFSIRTVYDNIKREHSLSKEYSELFKCRDNILFHISWAKNRGDLQEACILSEDLKLLDQVH